MVKNIEGIVLQAKRDDEGNLISVTLDNGVTKDLASNTFKYTKNISKGHLVKLAEDGSFIQKIRSVNETEPEKKFESETFKPANFIKPSATKRMAVSLGRGLKIVNEEFKDLELDNKTKAELAQKIGVSLFINGE